MRYINRYGLDLSEVNADTRQDVESALEDAYTNGYEDGLEEARFEYEDQLNSSDDRLALEQLVEAARTAHFEHDRVWPMRQCSHPVCELASRL